MTSTETLELLFWVARQPRTYTEAIGVWRTNCPQHSIWEDALDDGLIQVARNGSAVSVTLTPLGRSKMLELTAGAGT